MRQPRKALPVIFILSFVSLTAAAPLSVEVQKLFGADISNQSQVEFQSVEYVGQRDFFSVFDADDQLIEPDEEVVGRLEVTVTCGSADICYADYWVEYQDNGVERYFADGNTYYFSNGETKTIRFKFSAPSNTGNYDIDWYSGYENDVSSGNKFHTDTIAVEQDSDGDGIVDSNDECPLESGEEEYNGCPPPDSDGDGVPDDEDAFPQDPNCQEDTDGDGVCDSEDAFPEDPSETKDSDGDSVGDNADEYPDNPECVKDSDGDGVCDSNDAFPDNPEKSSDSDGDGVADSVDSCVNQPGPDLFNGCPDRDGDGVPVNKDLCEGTDLGPGDSVDENGCIVDGGDSPDDRNGTDPGRDIGTELDRMVFNFLTQLADSITSFLN